MISTCRRLISLNTSTQTLVKCLSTGPLLPKRNLLEPLNVGFELSRKKSKNRKDQSGTGSEKESEHELSIDDKHTKTMKINVTSMRLDGVIKSSLGMARNKIETIFYESKIRLNGEKVLKKSVSVGEGDEIDVIKGPSVTNPEFLTVARIEILSVTGLEDSISVKIRRCKSLTVEKYKDHRDSK